MKHLLIIANPNKNSFSHAMAEAYKNKCKKQNGEIEVLDLYDIKQMYLDYVDFDALKKAEISDVETMKSIQEKITWCDEMSFFFPVWWGTMPAILKNFFDTNFSSGFAFQYVKGKDMPEKLLTDKTAKIFCTCDAPGFIYKFPFLVGISIKKYLKSAILDFCGIKMTGFKLVGSLRKQTDEKRKQILESIAR